MKVIELGGPAPTLEEVMELAGRELVVLRRTNGEVFAVSQVDQFGVEAELLKGNPEFMALMRELSQEEGAISSEQLRQDLGVTAGKRKTRGRSQ